MPERVYSFLFRFGCATSNKVLVIMKLVSNFFSNQKIYGVNFKRIDNDLQSQIDNFDNYC